MPAWLGPVVQGVAAVGGALLGNRANRQTARDSMAFAERMSSTAAQRGVKDYAAAGLNPALAYDRPASSPGGTSAPQEDAVGKGLSSALAARQAQANIQLTQAQAEKVNAEKAMIDTDLNIRTITDGRPGEQPSWRDEQIARRVATLRDLAHQGRLQPHDERLRALAVLLAKEQSKRAGFIGESFEDAAALRNFIKAGISSAGDAAEAFRAWAQAGADRERSFREGVQRKYFNPQHPRAKAGRRSP